MMNGSESCYSDMRLIGITYFTYVHSIMKKFQRVIKYGADTTLHAGSMNARVVSPVPDTLY